MPSRRCVCRAIHRTSVRRSTFAMPLRLLLRILRRYAALTLVPALFTCRLHAARAEDDPQKAASQDLTKLSIEDLMKLEVTTASKSARPLSSVPAAIFVLTQDDIQ